MRREWSKMTVAEHLDAAQAIFEATDPNVNGLHHGLIHAQLHMSAALALSKKGES